MRTITGWRSTAQVSLKIKTVPADSDPYALHVARLIGEWYRAAGIDAQVTPMAEGELLRQVLLDNEFDLFVARWDRFRDPDTLYALLHSRFAEAPGWQNPFGFADLGVDELLETQRRTTGERRREALAELQRTVARIQPFSVVAFPDDIRAARRSGFTDWHRADLRSSLGYLALDRAEGADREGASAGGRKRTLRMAVTDQRVTENLNPLSVAYRRSGVFVDLLYDSLGSVAGDGTTTPWLADSWAFSTTADGPHATVRLRSGPRWHDGRPLSAADVAFTYRLLADTTLDSGGTGESSGSGGSEGDAGDDAQVPAPRFQGRSGLVAEVRARDPQTVEFQFVECDPGVAARALTVPILPEHVWAERTGTASVAGIEFGPATEALVTDNVPPVGSGPLRFVRNTPGEALVLEPFDDHYLARDAEDTLPTGVPGTSAFAFDRLAVNAVGSDTAAIQLVAEGEADVTGTPVGASTVPRIGRAGDLELLVDRSASPYLVGYNARRAPLTNPRFRNTLARLVDRAHVVDRVFDGYAEPAASPLAETNWPPDDLRWSGDHPLTPFFGSDGTLDAERARDAFRDAGFQYDGGKLVAGN
jgi:peptide/nickel transport system substrate-binding protein